MHFLVSKSAFNECSHDNSHPRPGYRTTSFSNLRCPYRSNTNWLVTARFIRLRAHLQLQLPISLSRKDTTPPYLGTTTSSIVPENILSHCKQNRRPALEHYMRSLFFSFFTFHFFRKNHSVLQNDPKNAVSISFSKLTRFARNFFRSIYTHSVLEINFKHTVSTSFSKLTCFARNLF